MHMINATITLGCYKLPINDYLRDDTLLKITHADPWYADIVNFIVKGYVPPGTNKRKLLHETAWTLLSRVAVCPIAAIRCARTLDRTPWHLGVSGCRSKLAMATATLALGVL